VGLCKVLQHEVWAGVCNCIFVTNHVLAWKGTSCVEGKECVRAGVPPRSKLGVRRQPNREAPQAR
jgi:hypothetical protein